MLVAPMARPAARRSARWAPTRRSPCCPTGRACSSTTSSSCSRRSRTRRSTRSARSWSRRSASTIGPEGNLLDADTGVVPAGRAAVPDHRQRRAREARSTSTTTATCRSSRRIVIPGLYPVAGGGAALARGARHAASRGVSDAIAAGVRIIVLSDRDSTEELAPIPSLLLTSAVHHHLIREKTRTKVGLVVESGDAREVHHMALLIGYGAGAINPYLAFETIEDLIIEGRLTGIDPHKAVKNYIKAAGKGVLKVMSKMGISTVASYTRRAGVRGDRPRPRARRRVLHRHRVAARRHRARRDRRGGRAAGTRPRYPPNPTERAHRDLDLGGEYQWRREGEYHLFNPETVFKLQHATPRASATTSSRSTRSSSTTSPRASRRSAASSRSRRGRAPAGADRRGRAGERDREALRDRRDVVRLDLEGSARDARDRDEPHRRQVEHRRGRRGRRPLHAATRTATSGARRSSRWRPGGSA